MSDAKVHAEPGVATFHKQLDAADYDGIWNDAHEDFRKASGKDAYRKFVEAVHRKLGNVKSTTNAGWQVNNYNFVTRVVLQQHTVFERGAGDETFTFVLKDNSPKLLGYNIQSTDLIVN
jgi:hypothetical protein